MNYDWKPSLDVAISLGGVVNTLWQFYLTVMVAVVAGLLFTDRHLNREQKFIATIAFGLFAGFNLFILCKTYGLFNAALDEVRARAEIAGSGAFASESLSSELSTIAIAPPGLPIFVHLVADAVVLILILSNRFRSPKNQRSITTTESSSGLTGSDKGGDAMTHVVTKEELPHVMAKEDLPFGGIAHKFEGYRYGEVGVSFFLVESPPGGGAVLHTHPYEEVFLTLEGEATFTVGDATIEAGAGQIVVAPAGVPHKFVNTGTGPLRQVDIHPSGRIRQENIPGDS